MSNTFSTLRAAINVSASGDTVVVSGVAGRQIIVISYRVLCAGAVNATWKSKNPSGAVALSGPMAIANAGDWLYADKDLDGHLATRVGDDLVLNLDGAVACGGHLTYNLQ